MEKEAMNFEENKGRNMGRSRGRKEKREIL